MAYLFFHDVKATSIGVTIYDLDENYIYNDRTVIWYVSTDDETVSFDNKIYIKYVVIDTESEYELMIEMGDIL